MLHVCYLFIFSYVCFYLLIFLLFFFPLLKAMRLLGMGCSSAVFSLLDNEERGGEGKTKEWETIALIIEQIFESGRNPLHGLIDRVALRLSRAMTFACSTCDQALADFIGFRHEILLTDELRKCCAATVSLSLQEHCRGAGHAHIIPNFAINPAVLIGNGRGSRWLVVEIKPKGVWRPPRVVGILVDGVEYYIHPVKLYQCRFSLMQLLKCERRGTGVAPPGDSSTAYCPNMLLIGDQPSIKKGIRHLIRYPANNFCLFFTENSSGEISDADLDDLSKALHESGILKVLENLQLCGCGSHSDWEVLDIELLYRWSSAREISNVQWIVRELDASSLKVECACQSGIIERWTDEGRIKDISTRFITPPIGLNECINRFYASTTAKDVSVLVSLLNGNTMDAAAASPAVGGPTGSRPRLELTQWKSLYGGVFVDFGFPNASICRVGAVDVDAKVHKSLSHYFILDKKVLAAWERWKSRRILSLR
ncbi:putative inositol-pentakisphosphate 2-kinase [Trypanosoma cruzi]|nr:putative inositol-pentakisphosphate 2-kinase [Trypanosoma cruzi]